MRNKFLRRNASTILTCIGGIGVVDELYWIDFNHRKVVMDDGLAVYILETPYGPRADWDEWRVVKKANCIMKGV